MLLALVLLAVPTADQLVGRWEGGGFVITLEKGGAGTLSDGPGVPPEAIQWKLKDKKLLVTEDGETVGYGVSLDGDTLSLTGGDLDQPVKLKRSSAKAAAKGDKGPRHPPKSARADCNDACSHYLGCVKNGTAEGKQLCLVECATSGLNEYQLAMFISTDCVTAIAIVDAAEQAAWHQVKGQQSSNSSDCQGCVRDGNSCVWLSQSNWGPGPYSGAAADCSPSCCGL